MLSPSANTTKESEIALCLNGNIDTSASMVKSSSKIPATDETVRQSWKGKLDFLMSLIAYAVGLGNVWRFPYLCHKNGGGAFLIPYCICWSMVAVPIFFLEIAAGQYFQQGGIGLWSVCPIFKGVGIANIIMACFSNVYYCVIAVWALYYLFASFNTVLPWTSCNNTWNDNNCVDLLNATKGFIVHESNNSQTPVEQFWENQVLQTSESIENIGQINWRLALLLVFAWIIIYFALWKGITSAQKFVYVCAIMPYIFLVILLVRGLTLSGSMGGIIYYLKPNIAKLLTTTIWKDAGTQVLYSYGIGFGALPALGSYNPYHHNCYRDAITLCLINACTSALAGFVVFSVLGHLAFIAHKTVEDVVSSGVGLAFLVYPELVSYLPIAPLWSCLFFLLIAILGLDSQICTVQGVVTAIQDAFPKLLRKELIVALVCVVNLILGLILVTEGGQYWLTLVDFYAAGGINLLIIVFFEVAGLAWGFGADRMLNALQDMIGFRPSRVWAFLWKYTSLGFLTIIFCLVVFQYEPLRYASGESYPVWAQIFGHTMSFVSVLAIFIYGAYAVYKSPGSTIRNKLHNSLKPVIPTNIRTIKSRDTMEPLTEPPPPPPYSPA